MCTRIKQRTHTHAHTHTLTHAHAHAHARQPKIKAKPTTAPHNVSTGNALLHATWNTRQSQPTVHNVFIMRVYVATDNAAQRGRDDEDDQAGRRNYAAFWQSFGDFFLVAVKTPKVPSAQGTAIAPTRRTDWMGGQLCVVTCSPGNDWTQTETNQRCREYRLWCACVRCCWQWVGEGVFEWN